MQILATLEKGAELQIARGFDVLEIFEESRTEKESEVNITLNVVSRILQEHRETLVIMNDIRNLLAESYNLLNDTLEDLMKEIRTSLMLLDDWVEDLEDINAQSMEKVMEIGLINKTIVNYLELIVAVIAKAKTEVTQAVNMFDSLVLKIPLLQANMSDAKEIGKSAFARAREQYNNASIVFNVTSQLEMQLSNNTPSIREVSISISSNTRRETSSNFQTSKRVQNTRWSRLFEKLDSY